MKRRDQSTPSIAAADMHIPPARRASQRPRAMATEMLALTMLGMLLVGPVAAADGSSAVKLGVPADNLLPATVGGTDDLSSLLPVLLTSPERKRLAAELEASLRQGDLKAAEGKLNVAIEMGTLAIVLIDRLRDQSLLTSLQSLGIKGGDQPSSPPDTGAGNADAGVCTLPAEPETSELLELRQALERERAHGSAIAQELAALTRDHHGLTAQKDGEAAAYTTRISELQNALEQERERNETTSRQLANLQDEHRALQDLASRNVEATKGKVSELEEAWRKERERSEAATRQLAGAEEELRRLRTLKEQSALSEAALVAELKGALAQERVRGDALTRELADAIEELRARQEAEGSSETPLMFRLTASGAPTPLETLREEQPAQSLLVTGTITPSPRSEPEQQAIVTASAVPFNLPRTETAPPADAARAVPLPAPGIIGKPQPPVAASSPEERLLARSEELLNKGDVSGARLLLERLAESGNARAAFMLAETFDPRVLSRLGVFGIRGDVAKARELYTRARTLGSAQAGERIDALK